MGSQAEPIAPAIPHIVLTLVAGKLASQPPRRTLPRESELPTTVADRAEPCALVRQVVEPGKQPRQGFRVAWFVDQRLTSVAQYFRNPARRGDNRRDPCSDRLNRRESPTLSLH